MGNVLITFRTFSLSTHKQLTSSQVSTAPQSAGRWRSERSCRSWRPAWTWLEAGRGPPTPRWLAGWRPPGGTRTGRWPTSGPIPTGDRRGGWTLSSTGSRPRSSACTCPGASPALTSRTTSLLFKQRNNLTIFTPFIKMFLTWSSMRAQGSPVWLIPLGRADVKGLLAAVDKQQIINFVLRILETSAAILRKTSAPTKLNKHSFVFDMAGLCLTVRFCLLLNNYLDVFSVPQKFICKDVLVIIHKIIIICQENYPETLKSMFFINSSAIPKLFLITLKKHLMTKTRNKISIIPGPLSSVGKSIFSYS